MKVLLAICLVGIGLLVGCGGGPTAPNDKLVTGPPPTQGPAAQPTPVPQPCRPQRNCED